MADGIEAKLTGFDEIQKKLAPFSRNSRAMRRILTRAGRSGMKSTRDKVKANAKALDDPKDPRKIWKNIYTKINSKHFNSRGYIVAKVGIRGGAKSPPKGTKKDAATSGAPGGDTFYWRFLEFGTAHATAHPFMRPAFKPEQIQLDFSKHVSGAIAKEVKKHGTPE